MVHPKIIKKDGNPDQFETSIAQALLELEVNSDLKAQLRELHITKAKEVDLFGKKSIIIYVPMPQRGQFQKIQTRLVRELEKKFSGKHVVFIGDRKILPKPTRKTRMKNKQKRPRSRTLTSVYDAILEDLVYPAEIVGKRIRVKLDGKQIIKVHLDKTQQTNIEHKLRVYPGAKLITSSFHLRVYLIGGPYEVDITLVTSKLLIPASVLPVLLFIMSKVSIEAYSKTRDKASMQNALLARNCGNIRIGL